MMIDEDVDDHVHKVVDIVDICSFLWLAALRGCHVQHWRGNMRRSDLSGDMINYRKPCSILLVSLLVSIRN